MVRADQFSWNFGPPDQNFRRTKISVTDPLAIRLVLFMLWHRTERKLPLTSKDARNKQRIASTIIAYGNPPWLYILAYKMGTATARMASSRLLLFNSCTSVVMYGAGDVLQQYIEGRDCNDWKRTGRMAGVGLAIGAMNHYWYSILDQFLPGVAGRVVVKKVLADQGVYGPVCLSTFFIGELSKIVHRSVRYVDKSRVFWLFFSPALFRNTHNYNEKH